MGGLKRRQEELTVYKRGYKMLVCINHKLESRLPGKISRTSDFPGGSNGKVSAYNAGDLGSIPGSGSPPGEGNGNPLQYSCLENPMDGEAWQATVHGVAKSRTRLIDFNHSLTQI